MKYYDWNEDKNQLLKEERGIGFENVVIALEAGDLLDTVDHPNKERYRQQKMFVIKINNYVYLVPYIEDEEKIFFKTIIPSRKATKQFLSKGEK